MSPFRWNNPFKLTPDKNAPSTELNQLANDRQFIEGHLDPVFLIDVDGTIIDANQKLGLLLGYPTADLPNHYSSLMTPQERARILPHVKRVFEGHEETYIANFLHTNGKSLTVLVTTIPKYESQLIVGMYVIARDMTEDNQMKEQLETMTFERKLLRDTPHLLAFTIQPDGRLTDRTNSFLSTIGESVTTFDRLIQEIHQDDRASLMAAYRNASEQNQNDDTFTFRFTRHTQQSYFFGKLVGHQGVVRAIFSNETHHVNMAEVIVENADRLKDLYDYADATIYRRNLTTGHCELYTNGFEALFGFEPSKIKNNPSAFQRVIHRQDWPNVKAACQQARDGIAQHIYYRIHRNQEVCWVEERMIPKFDEHDVVTSIVSVCYDITRFKQQETEIWNLAMHDTVTNLPNRSHFMSELQQWIQRHEQVAVLTLSFNSIHPINRDFGYTVGDEWITATANALTDHLSADSFVGYLGGDDYGILVPNLENEQEVIQFCQSLIRRSERYITVGPYEWSPTVSVGVSRYPHDADQPNTLLQYAHTALGRTRLHGSDPIVFYASTFDIDSFRKHQLGNDLRHAIEEGELFLEFQPKVDIWSGRLVGAEALVRWQHPEWGRIPPSDFIALSEETDLHIALSDWVLKETCRQLQEWKNRHLAVVPISINISPKRLLHKTYSETVLRILRQYDLSPSLLEIEILETGILSDNVKIHESLNQLNEAGIRIALDDFGTGYSSLSYLQRYPIKTIKIDQQFVKDLYDSKKTQGIVRTILFMSEEFDIDVVIEGVETLQQLEVLRRLNCKIVQGYLFSRPLGAEAFADVLKTPVLTTNQSGPTVTRQGFSIDATITIHRLNRKEVTIGSTPVLLTKSSQHSLHFYATVRLPVTKNIELKMLLSHSDEQIELFVQPKSMIELDNGIYEYEATYLNPSDARRISTVLQKQMNVP